MSFITASNYIKYLTVTLTEEVKGLYDKMMWNVLLYVLMGRSQGDAIYLRKEKYTPESYW